MALTGVRYIDNLEIRVTIRGPQSQAVVPTLELNFEVRSNYDEEITLFPFKYELSVQHPNLNAILGSSSVNTVLESVFPMTRIQKSRKVNFYSNFEIGYDKLGILIDRIEGDLYFSVRFFGTFIKFEAEGLKSYNFGTDISRIKIPTSEWVSWMSTWLGERKILIISGSLWKQLFDLKKRLGLLGDEDLLKELFDNYPDKK